MNLEDQPFGQASIALGEKIARDIHVKVLEHLESVPGYDLEYAQYVVICMIKLAFGTERLYPEINLDWLHVPERRNPGGVVFVFRVLRDVIIKDAEAACSKICPPELKTEEYERFMRAVFLNVADEMLRPLRMDLSVHV